MSAYLVDKAHIDALVSAALAYTRDGSMFYYQYANGDQTRVITKDNAGQVGAMLWAQNARSVNERYSESNWEPPYELAIRRHPLAPVAVLKAVQGYEYQSCETEDWAASEAYAFCQALQRCYIGKLPGYSEADWEIVNA